MKLTKDSVEALVRPAGKQEHAVWDDSLPGFGVRLRGNSKTWCCTYRINGAPRRESLGDVRKVPLEVARKIALQRFSQTRLGIDPALLKRRSLEQQIAHKALTFLKQGQEPACYLYRHYHPNGDLLYAGISLEPLRRQGAHRRSATWRDMICRILIEPFATREEALAAELHAIRTEFPKFNSVHNTHRHPFQELARGQSFSGD